MIELREIELIVGQGTPLEKTLFRNLNLKIEKGQFVTLLGGNGAGKSSLLKLISGELKPSRGQLFFAGQDVTEHSVWQRSSWVSRLFQDIQAGSFGELSIEENLSLAYRRGRTRGLRLALTQPLQKLFREALARLGIGLEDRLSDEMNSLSGGQRQAVCLLMATLQPSRILLLDEHTAALDPLMEQKVMQLTAELISGQKLTTLMITHCMKQSLTYGQRTLILQQGQISRDLSHSELLQLSPSDLLAWL